MDGDLDARLVGGGGVGMLVLPYGYRGSAKGVERNTGQLGGKKHRGKASNEPAFIPSFCGGPFFAVHRDTC